MSSSKSKKAVSSSSPPPPPPSSSKSSTGVTARPLSSVIMESRLSLLSGLIECTFAMMELLFGLSVLKGMFQSIYTSMNPGEAIPAWNRWCMHMARNLTILYWMIYRISVKQEPIIQPVAMMKRLGIYPLRINWGTKQQEQEQQEQQQLAKRKKDDDHKVTDNEETTEGNTTPATPASTPNSFPSFSQYSSFHMILILFTLHLLGFLGMLFVQYLRNDWIFSWENYYGTNAGNLNTNTSTDRAFDPITVTDMLFLAPLREEITFRALIFTIFYNRAHGRKILDEEEATHTTTAASFSLSSTSSWQIECILWSSFWFGVIHLLNLFGKTYTVTYIILQVILGMLLGAFFSFRFLLSQSLLEPILLHCVNNIFSSFLPIHRELDLSDPLILCSLLVTIAVYGTLTYKAYQEVKKNMHHKQLHVIQID